MVVCSPSCRRAVRCQMMPFLVVTTTPHVHAACPSNLEFRAARPRRDEGSFAHHPPTHQFASLPNCLPGHISLTGTDSMQCNAVQRRTSPSWPSCMTLHEETVQKHRPVEIISTFRTQLISFFPSQRSKINKFNLLKFNPTPDLSS